MEQGPVSIQRARARDKDPAWYFKEGLEVWMAMGRTLFYMSQSLIRSVSSEPHSISHVASLGTLTYGHLTKYLASKALQGSWSIQFAKKQVGSFSSVSKQESGQN